MTQFNSPCIDHDNNCSLDLERLKRDIKYATRSVDWGLGEAAYLAEIKAAQEAATAAQAVANACRDSSKTTALNQAMWEARRQLMAVEGIYRGEAAMVTLLCSIKARHRGRVHGTRRRMPDGTVIEWTKEKQAEFLAQAGINQTMLDRYTRTCPMAQAG